MAFTIWTCLLSMQFLYREVFTIDLEFDIIYFSDGFRTKVLVGTPPQEIYMQLSLEDDKAYLIDKNCVQYGYCKTNASGNFFVSEQSTTYHSDNLRFDGSVNGRPYPTGHLASDFVQLSKLAENLELGVAERCPFLVQGVGVLGLAPSMDEGAFVRRLLRRVRQPVLGISARPGALLPYWGELVVGGGARRCGGNYQFVATSPTASSNKQWIFETHRTVFHDIVDTSNYSITIKPGQPYTVAPDAFFNRLKATLNAQRANDDDPYHYVHSRHFEYDMIFPNLGFDLGGFVLVAQAAEYLGEETAYGRRLLIRARARDYVGLHTDWVLGDNILQRYCVLLEYTNNPRVGFAAVNEVVAPANPTLMLGVLITLGRLAL